MRALLLTYGLAHHLHTAGAGAEAAAAAAAAAVSRTAAEAGVMPENVLGVENGVPIVSPEAGMCQ